jgi:GNAT superfamily N-acetyltransferase
MSTTIRSVSSTELENLVPALVELFRDLVNGGSSMGFLPPLTHDDARKYWLSLRPELEDGSRLLLAAYAEDRMVGSVQLKFASWPNAPHRAEVQKLFVDDSSRGQGVGGSLMGALHDAARQHGRSLLLLHTRHGGRAESFYKRLGYREVGVTPGYVVGRAGERFDDVTLYQELEW